MDIWKFIDELDRIAKHNDDEFGYHIDLQSKVRRFVIRVRETADGHELVNGRGATIEDACAAAWDDIAETMSYFGYEVPDQESTK